MYAASQDAIKAISAAAKVTKVVKIVGKANTLLLIFAVAGDAVIIHKAHYNWRVAVVKAAKWGTFLAVSGEAGVGLSEIEIIQVPPFTELVHCVIAGGIGAFAASKVQDKVAHFLSVQVDD